MTLFHHTDKNLDVLPDLRKEKKLSKILGTDFMLTSLRKLSGPELGNFRLGALALTLVFGSSGYYFYRQNKKSKFMVSSNYYKLINLIPLNAGKQFWFNVPGGETNEMTYYHRMPRKEFDIKYRMRSAFIEGEFDHDKEILIPRKKNGQDGYDVITPFYYYKKIASTRFLNVHADGTTVKGMDTVPAGIAVFRGWIPATMKDRRLRPKDVNVGEVETLQGTIKLSTVDKHDFTEPNDPTHNLWTNYNLEDMAIYWNLPNIPDAKHCYFQEINFGELGHEKNDVFPIRPNIREAIVEDGKEIGMRLDRNYRRMSYVSSSLGAFFAYLLYLAA